MTFGTKLLSSTEDQKTEDITFGSSILEWKGKKKNKWRQTSFLIPAAIAHLGVNYENKRIVCLPSSKLTP